MAPSSPSLRAYGARLVVLGLLPAVAFGSQGPPECPKIDGIRADCRILNNPAPVEDSNFGSSLTVLDFDGDGNRDIAVGAPARTTDSQPGRVWIFYGPELTRVDELVPSDSNKADRFGYYLAAGNVDGRGGDELAVGAPGASVHGRTGAGRISLFTCRNGEAVETASFTSPAPTTGARLGTNVILGDFLAGAGLEVAAAAPRALVPETGLTSGAVYLFRPPGNGSPSGGPSPGGLGARRAGEGLATAHPGATATDPAPSALFNPRSTSDLNSFGNHLSSGDWNGDGREDLFVAAIFNDATHGGSTYPFAGQVLVYTSPVSAPTEVLDNPLPWIDPPPLPGGQLAPCGYQRYGMWIDTSDLDGDGLTELAVGANRIDALSGECEVGRAFLWSPSVPTELMFEHPTPPAEEDLMGWRVVFGDFVGDKGPDLAVASLSKLKPHAVFIWDGAVVAGQAGVAGPPTRFLQSAPGHGPHFAEGAAAADLDGSGRDELIHGDFEFRMGALENVGRVVITFWP